jgi:hypothetical protein
VGTFSLSIVIGTMAVEAYLTRLFLKLKGLDNYAATFNLPTAAGGSGKGTGISAKRWPFGPC